MSEVEPCPVLVASCPSPSTAWRGAVVAGRFVLTERLGDGAMGLVFVAHDRTLDREVALKLPKPGLCSKRVAATSSERFRREATGLARVRHENVVAVLSSGEGCACHESPYIAMERVLGTSLDELIATEGPLHPQTVLTLGAGIARGLEAVHAAGLFHRDIKPSNVLVTADTGTVKIADFGLVKMTYQLSHLTDPTALLGSLGYMAPERILDNAADARSDIYALGVTLYEMLAGERPFQGGSSRQLVMDHLAALPTPLRLRPGIAVSHELEALVLRCLAKSPDERVQTAAELADALSAMADPGGAPEPRASRPPSVLRAAVTASAHSHRPVSLEPRSARGSRTG